ncbi:hypothetical protein AB0903_04330 [Streptomyces sp. NPDC048389]|uniref:hypothetical protein n=1 Tax=Streptomyces sp. NPDC048389 TaxID=3154622 RepID=UPI003456DDC2
MLHFILLLCEPLLRFLLPPSGRHRHHGRPQPSCGTASAVVAQSPPCPLLRGEDSRLVRPYLTAHEARESVRLQRQRRRALWLAVHGIDVGPRLIHGVEVA